jgi:Zn-dependent M28 family amino/carboxypeptidase
VRGSPGANDNASGAAAVLALARRFADRPQARTIRFVLFVNEEPPLFWTDQMGSLVYAREAKQRGDDIVAMLSLETMGCFLDEPGSQRYPPPFGMFYPDEGNFIAFVGMSSSGPLVERAVGAFRGACRFPSEGAALPSLVPRVGSSDHWSFWKQGYPALMVTDTAPYRYRHYHKPTDTPDKLDYERLARVVEGLDAVIRVIASDE